jgi:predicted Zn-dependent peptidase
MTLKNGLKILKIPKKSHRTFLVGFVVPTGTLVEINYFPKNISELTRRLFWQGTDKYNSSKQLNLILENLGGVFQSFVTPESTHFYLTVPDYNQYKAISLLADIIQHSYFDVQDLQIQKQILHSQDRSFDDLEAETLEIFTKNLFLADTGSSFIENVLQITQSDILEYLSHQYQTKESYLVLSGNFEDKNISELVSQEWEFWNPKTKSFIQPRSVFNLENAELPQFIYRQKGISSSQINLAFVLDQNATLFPHLIEPEEEAEVDRESLYENFLMEWAKIYLLNTILGQGMSSRLWTKSVEEEMLLETVQSSLVRFSNKGYFQINAACENSQFSFGLESILQILESLKKTTVSINELSKAKELLKGQLILEQENLLSTTVWQVEQTMFSNLPVNLDDFLGAVQKIQAAELRALACDLFLSEKLALLVLGPNKESRLVERLVERYLS